MANIKIKHIEVMGIECGAEELAKVIVNTLSGDGMDSEEINITVPDAQETLEEKLEGECCNMRIIQHTHITPGNLKDVINEKKLDSLLHPFDEIDIPFDTGETVTAVCAYVEPEWARFVFKDCWDMNEMNDDSTNKGGYYKSEGRMHVLENIYPHILQEWKDIIKPRSITENIDGKRVVYEDPLWLLSATDVFGTSEEGYWNDIDDSFQLPIFEKARDRVKACGDNETDPYWLRSVHVHLDTNFFSVFENGERDSDSAIYDLGFAPGFDI